MAAAGWKGIGPDMLPQVHAALAGSFHLAFLACAIAMVAALVVALGMQDLPLRAGVESDSHAGWGRGPAGVARALRRWAAVAIGLFDTPQFCSVR